jgi:hypothetical protein
LRCNLNRVPAFGKKKTYNCATPWETRMDISSRKWLPTDVWVRLAIVPVLVFVALASDRNYLADFWHHLARGQAMALEHRLVNHDEFTFTVPGVEFQDVNWLTQLLYYRLFDLGGLPLVQTVNALLLALALGWLVVLCRRKSCSLVAATATGIGVFFGLWQVLTIRPQTCSILLFVIVMDLLDRSTEDPGSLFVVPGLIALWANLHGAFPAGIMLIGCSLLASLWRGWRTTGLRSDRYSRRLALCLAASLLATLVNPYSWRIYEYVGLTSNLAAARRIDEWAPPTLDLWIGKAWLISLFVMAGLILVSWRKLGRRPSVRELLLIGCFLPLACSSARMVAWWLLVIAPMAATMLAGLFPRLRDQAVEQTQPNRGAGFLFAAFTVAVVLSLPGLQHLNPLLTARRNTPRVEEDLDRVHAFLAKQSADGRIFSRFEWGEYLTWSCAPNYKVFMDGRIEIYPDSVWDQYAEVTQGLPGWHKILDDYQVDFLVLDREYHARTGLLPRVAESPQWTVGFETGQAVVFVRTPSQDTRVSLLKRNR